MSGVAEDFGEDDPSQASSFRTSWTQPEGGRAAHIYEGRIVDLNLKNWTVDFSSQYDQRFYLNVQVASPYMHPNQGEGIYAFPEIGAKCLLCIPSDGLPPFIIGFFMPQETIPDESTDEAPEGTVSRGDETGDPATNATFSGGRMRPKPGDIYIKGRDGNFCVLHRGGVLQIGSTSLAQRIFIPIGNIVTDISQNYHHHNTGGSIRWAVSPGSSENNPPTAWKQTFRLFANEEKATVRISAGTISDLVGVPSTETGGSEILAEGIGENTGTGPIVYEVTVSPEQIEADSGGVNSDTQKQTKLQFAFDKGGGSYLWARGSVVLATKKKLVVVADDTISFSTDKNFSVEAKTGARISGGTLLELRADVVQIGPGTDDVAHVGSIVDVTLPPGLPISAPVAPGSPAVSIPITIKGLVSTGKPNVKV